MLIIRTAEALSRALASPIPQAIKELLRLDGAEFVIVQSGDRAADIEKALGFPLLYDLEGCHFDDPDFVSAFEWIRHHDPGWYEACLILSDEGAATVLLVPDQQDIDRSLLALCKGNLTPAT